MVLNLFTMLRGTELALARGIPNTPPPVPLEVPRTVRGILVDPLALRLMPFPLLLMMMRVMRDT